MNRNASITSVGNNLKKMYLGTTLLNQFNSTYYDDKYHSFAMLFQQYTVSFVNFFYHPYLIE